MGGELVTGVQTCALPSGGRRKEDKEMSEERKKEGDEMREEGKDEKGEKKEGEWEGEGGEEK